jgi:hypothetical protein
VLLSDATKHIDIRKKGGMKIVLTCKRCGHVQLAESDQPIETALEYAKKHTACKKKSNKGATRFCLQ